MTAPYFVGIDVSKDTLDVHILPTGYAFSVSNAPEGFEDLLEILAANTPECIVLEATGGYERLVSAYLFEAGMPIVVANPRHVRNFARGLGLLAKTDAIDALVLARYAEAAKPEIRPLPTEGQRLLTDLLARRRQLIVMRAAEKNRSHQACDDAIEVSIETMMEALTSSLEEIDEEIDAAIEASPKWRENNKLLQSYSCVGPVTARTLLADLPELGHIDHKRIASLAGLAPINHDSGQFRGTRHIRAGRSTVRTALYMVSVSAIQHNERIKIFYRRLREAGKSTKVALTACAHKILTHLNAMMRDGETWNPQTA